MYRWNEQLLNWTPLEETADYQVELINPNEAKIAAAGPTEVSWEALMDIRYQLYYFKKVEMEIFAPVFPKAIQALDGKEVILEGFVLPSMKKRCLCLSIPMLRASSAEKQAPLP